MRRRSVYQPAPPDATRYSYPHAPAPNLKRHTRTRTQSGPLATGSGTRPRPSSPRPLHWRAGVYFGTPAVAYAHETGHRPHQARPQQQYGSIASRWSPPKFATAPRQYAGPAYAAARRPQHQRRPTEAQVIAARYRTQKPLPPTPVSSMAGMSLGPADSLFVNAPSSTLAPSVGGFPDPRAGGAEYRPRVEERYVQEAYPQMMAAWYEGHNFIKCPRARCREAYPTLLDMAWHLQLHDYKSRHINSYGWPATAAPQRASAHGNPVFEVDLSGYHPRFSLKRVKNVLAHLLCLLTCTRCCTVCSYDPNPSF